MVLELSIPSSVTLTSIIASYLFTIYKLANVGQKKKNYNYNFYQKAYRKLHQNKNSMTPKSAAFEG